MLVTVTFEDLGQKTLMTLRSTLRPRIEERMRGMMTSGWNMTLDRLVARYPVS
jgi:uncharacterized protein YndB with AHSA1/START domain